MSPMTAPWVILAICFVSGCDKNKDDDLVQPATQAKRVASTNALSSPNASSVRSSATQSDGSTRMSDQKRRQRFEKRRPISIDGLPTPWRTFVKAVGGKAIALGTIFQLPSILERGRHIVLTVRAFGRDPEVDARILKGLRQLKLPNLPEKLADYKTKKGLIEWSVRLDRVVAPKGAARQTQVKIDWLRRPKASPDAKSRCAKFNETTGYENAPNWLARALTKRSTRRRIRWEQEISRDTVTDRQFMLYHNGFAHDENVGLLAKTLKTQGFKRQEGSGPKQVWRHADGQSVRWHPAPRNLDVGCTLRGPVLTVTWTRPTK